MRGTPDAARAALVRVQPMNPLADALHWRRPDLGPMSGEVLAMLADAGDGALVLLDEPTGLEALLARIRAPQEAVPQARDGQLAEWRRNGAGAQILHDLGYGKLRVLGTPRRQVALAGFGLDVVEHIDVGRPGDVIR